MQEKIIQQGAEAIIIKRGNDIIKRRIPKTYRLPILDEKLRKQRTKKEARLLQKASAIIPIPKIIKINEKDKEIEMEFIKGKKLSEHLDSLKNKVQISKTIGKQIALLHDNDIIHGDLTTSNIILSDKDKKLYFIDFGLGFSSNKIEDKAVDLHLIKQALEAKHFKYFKSLTRAVLDGYSISKTSKETLARLKKVASRGRYKEQY